MVWKAKDFLGKDKDNFSPVLRFIYKLVICFVVEEYSKNNEVYFENNENIVKIMVRI